MRVRSAVLLAVLAVGLAAAKESSAKVETKLVAPAANITVDEVGFRTAYAAHTAFAFEILIAEESVGHGTGSWRWVRGRLSWRAVWWA